MAFAKDKARRIGLLAIPWLDVAGGGSGGA